MADAARVLTHGLPGTWTFVHGALDVDAGSALLTVSARDASDQDSDDALLLTVP